MENLNFKNFLIGKEDRLEIISKIFQGQDICVENICVEEKYNSDILTLKGSYHQHITKNYEEMKRFYLMAIELENSIAMNNFGIYLDEIRDYEGMRKYYKMAIELGNNNCAMNNL